LSEPAAWQLPLLTFKNGPGVIARAVFAFSPAPNPRSYIPKIATYGNCQMLKGALSRVRLAIKMPAIFALSDWLSFQ
jgi:hypothetical protein